MKSSSILVAAGTLVDILTKNIIHLYYILQIATPVIHSYPHLAISVLL